MVSAKSVQNRPVKLVIAALAKWHQTLVEALKIPWTSPLTVALKRATANLATVMAPTLGRASADPYQAVSKRLLELHSKGAGFPSETAAEDLRVLVRQCGIATASFGVFTRQDRALKYLESRLAHSSDVQKLRGGRVREEDKRHLIWQAMDEKIYTEKDIQAYVARELGNIDELGNIIERVGRKMISEVRKARQAKGLRTR